MVIAITVIAGFALQALAGAVQGFIPVGTELRIRLEETISSKEAHVDDRFTATVVDAGRYNGAKIHGHIESIKQSGRIKGATEIYLSFDEIRLRDGESLPMAAEILRLYDAESGEYVDAEGAIETQGRGHQTLKRTGIGALAGGLFGAIFGGKGAAVGSIVGGAAGASSTAQMGSKELVVDRGTEMLIRTIRR